MKPNGIKLTGSAHDPKKNFLPQKCMLCSFYPCDWSLLNFKHVSLGQMSLINSLSEYNVSSKKVLAMKLFI